MKIWCKHCGEYVREEPDYCPGCGEEFERRTPEDIDWPVEIEVTSRVNLPKEVEFHCDVPADDLHDPWNDWTTEYPVHVTLRVYRDGTVEMAGDDE